MLYDTLTAAVTTVAFVVLVALALKGSGRLDALGKAWGLVTVVATVHLTLGNVLALVGISGDGLKPTAALAEVLVVVVAKRTHGGHAIAVSAPVFLVG